MTQKRLNYFAIKANYKEQVDELTLNELIDYWRAGSTTRHNAVASLQEIDVF